MGGICNFVRSSTNYKITKDFADKNLELIALEIKKPNSRSFLVATWYRPPKSPVCIFDSFEQFIPKADKTYEDIYIFGDMNCDFMRDPLESHTKCLTDVLDVYQFFKLYIPQLLSCRCQFNLLFLHASFKHADHLFILRHSRIHECGTIS